MRETDEKAQKYVYNLNIRDLENSSSEVFKKPKSDGIISFSYMFQIAVGVEGLGYLLQWCH